MVTAGPFEERIYTLSDYKPLSNLDWPPPRV